MRWEHEDKLVTEFSAFDKLDNRDQPFGVFDIKLTKKVDSVFIQKHKEFHKDWKTGVKLYSSNKWEMIKTVFHPYFADKTIRPYFDLKFVN